MTQQQNKFNALLLEMIEGVIVLDQQHRIIELNNIAGQTLGFRIQEAVGQDIKEATAHKSLLAFVHKAVNNNSPCHDEITVQYSSKTSNDIRHLQVRSAIWGSDNKQRQGTIILFNDVTRLRRLEAVRRDFVANVSHEIKTPISAIKAAIETLEDKRGTAPKDASRFQKIIARQADRLDAIVKDLLTLARIEHAQDGDSISAELKPAALEPILIHAIETCQASADAKQIKIDLKCDSSLIAQVNAPLLEQAAVNLVDNAVKYSPQNATVAVGGKRDAGGIQFFVADKGPGIDIKHQPRIFERFYRTDSARSRALGGTGLGLAIVKHVAEIHGGKVSLDSTVGQGSTFYIQLRLPDASAFTDKAAG